MGKILGGTSRVHLSSLRQGRRATASDDFFCWRERMKTACFFSRTSSSGAVVCAPLGSAATLARFTTAVGFGLRGFGLGKQLRPGTGKQLSTLVLHTPARRSVRPSVLPRP